MLFTQIQFWIFFAIVFSLYLILPLRRQNWLLLLASYAFYAAWDWRFLSLIMLTTGMDYLIALQISRSENQHKRRQWLILSLWTNLGLLGVFKYFNFFLDSFVALSEGLGFSVSVPVLQIVLPVGISFYTFQSLSYTIDVYRRDIQPTRSFLDFALFVAFFPQLVAGPIERARNLLPAIANPRQITPDRISRGVVLCLIGLIKKIVIADGISPNVDMIFAMENPSGAAVLVGSWLFAIQIYCDFSGYTDIARGIAKLLGFELMLNFAQPYFATNPQDFWRRWHISLSTWLRDYLYISLGGNRKGPRRTQINLMLTMLLGGLWHGAAWNFVLWGAFQGGLLALHRQLFGIERKSPKRQGMRQVLRHIFMVVLFFQITCYGWMLFRAGSLEQIIQMTSSLFTLNPADFAQLGFISLPVPALVGLLLLFAHDMTVETTGDSRFYKHWRRPLRAGLYAVMIYALAFGATVIPGGFIYSQF